MWPRELALDVANKISDNTGVSVRYGSKDKYEHRGQR